MTNAFSVNIPERPHELIGVQFDDQIGDFLFHFQVLFHYSVGRVGDIVHYNV